MFVDVALDPDTNDIALNERGESYLVEGLAAIVQDIRCKFPFFKGEWFLDRREGTPWYQSILGRKDISLASLNLIWRQVVLSAQGVTVVKSCSTVWVDRANRSAQVVFEAESDEGTILSEDWPPLIVRVPDAVEGL